MPLNYAHFFSRSSKKFTDSFDEKTAAFEMDSITYDFRQASPEDSLNHHQPQQLGSGEKTSKEKQKYREDSYYDSLGDFARQGPDSSPKKKLIIPYNNGSFSSNTSIYSGGSRDGSRDGSIAGSDYDLSLSSKTAEPDSLGPQVVVCGGDRDRNLTLDLSALPERKSSVSDEEHPMTLQPIRRQSTSSIGYPASPMPRISESWRPDGFHRQQQHRPEMNSRPGSRTQSPIRMLAQQNNPLVSQSLMRMATERMKRKFLGWN